MSHAPHVVIVGVGSAGLFAARAREGAAARDAMRSLLAVATACGIAWAGDALVVGEARVDPPTVVTLGVQWLVSGDANGDARVDLRFRRQGARTWRDAMALFRVHPEDVVGRDVPDQFAGSIFDLSPATTYEIELRATDPDGGVDETVVLTATTRAVPPWDPAAPSEVAVSDAAALQAALWNAAPGDVIVIAGGTYVGPFEIDASGTADGPIVIRGAGAEATTLTGDGCSGCNVLEVYGSFVHVERLTLASANRALRFQGEGAEANVVRYVRAEDVTLGFGARDDQSDFYVCDNDLEGPLEWPFVYWDDGGASSNVDGILVMGTGHVVCHNRLRGFGDALKFGQDGARGVDFYGNEVLSAYDNGIEFDGCEGNVRAFRNRFTNTFATISFQPVYGGPAYALRNVVVNVAHENLKFHSLGGDQETSGIFVVHNTFVRPALALSLQDSTTSHHFIVANNLFVGPAVLDGERTVDWTGGIDDGIFNWNGWFPDGRFDFGDAGDWASFSAMQSSGVFEENGTLLAGPPFASGLTAPADYTETVEAADASLADASPPRDTGSGWPNVNEDFTGSAPDLGALEAGCPLPIYGPRPDGTDETNTPGGCGGAEGEAEAEAEAEAESEGEAGGGDSGGCGCALGSRS